MPDLIAQIGQTIYNQLTNDTQWLEDFKDLSENLKNTVETFLTRIQGATTRKELNSAIAGLGLVNNKVKDPVLAHVYNVARTEQRNALGIKRKEPSLSRAKPKQKSVFREVESISETPFTSPIRVGSTPPYLVKKPEIPNAST